MAKKNKIIQSAKNKIQKYPIFRLKTGLHNGNKRHKVHMSHSLYTISINDFELIDILTIRGSIKIEEI